MGPLRSGPRGGTGPWGQYKTPDMLGSIRAQRGRARSALFYRVPIIYCFYSRGPRMYHIIPLGLFIRYVANFGKTLYVLFIEI